MMHIERNIVVIHNEAPEVSILFREDFKFGEEACLDEELNRRLAAFSLQRGE